MTSTSATLGNLNLAVTPEIKSTGNYGFGRCPIFGAKLYHSQVGTTPTYESVFALLPANFPKGHAGHFTPVSSAGDANMSMSALNAEKTSGKSMSGFINLPAPQCRKIRSTTY